MSNVLNLAEFRDRTPSPQRGQECAPSTPEQAKPFGKRPMRVDPYNALRCAAAFEQIAAGIRALDEYAPTAGIKGLKAWRDAFWAQLATTEKLAAYTEEAAQKAMDEEEARA